MTDFDIKSTLECVPSKTFIEVDFRNSGGYPIHVRFTDKDVSVIGDYGCWVFKGNIVNPYRFFCGNQRRKEKAWQKETPKRTFRRCGGEEVSATSTAQAFEKA